MQDKGYKYTAVTPVSVKPDLVDPAVYGHHQSKGNGVDRFWMFETESGRDRFMAGVKAGKFTKRLKA